MGARDHAVQISAGGPSPAGGPTSGADTRPIHVRHVQVDEHEFWVTVGADGMLSVREAASGVQRRVWMPNGRRPTSLWCDGRVHTLAIRNPQELALEAIAGDDVAAHGHARVNSPMPGRVVRVLVRNDDEVAAGAPLLIIEAMKMENEVRAPSTGRVEGLSVQPGDTVDGGALLCEIVAHEPPA